MKEEVEFYTKMFVSLIKQVVPSYQRRVLTFLAKNKHRKFSNVEIAKALQEDRSNIWRTLNMLSLEESPLVKKDGQKNRVLYQWNEPKLHINNLAVSDILQTIEYLESQKNQKE